MKVKLKSIVAGPDIRGGVGEVIEVEPAMGKALIAGGYAEDVEVAAPAPEAPPIAEEAVMPPPENASLKKKGK